MIRFDRSLNKEIARTVSAFNKKVYRLEKLNRELIPERVTVKGLKSSFDKRRVLMRELRKLRRFSIRGAEQAVKTEGGVYLTKWELGEIKRESARVKSALTQRIKKYEQITPTVFGRRQARKFAEMGSESISNLRARRQILDKDLLRLTKSEFSRYLKNLSRFGEGLTRKDLTFYNSYFDIIDKTGFLAGIDPSKLEYIKARLAKLSPDQFINLFQTEMSLKGLIDYYLILKLETGNLATEDASQLTDFFDSLYEIIDQLVADYA